VSSVDHHLVSGSLLALCCTDGCCPLYLLTCRRQTSETSVRYISSLFCTCEELRLERYENIYGKINLVELRRGNFLILKNMPINTTGSSRVWRPSTTAVIGEVNGNYTKTGGMGGRRKKKRKKKEHFRTKLIWSPRPVPELVTISTFIRPLVLMIDRWRRLVLNTY